MGEPMALVIELDDVRLDSRLQRLLIFALAIAILIADFWVIGRADQLRNWINLPIDSEWNWLGKILSIAFSCLVLACSPWLRQNAGLRWRQAPGSARFPLVVLSSIWPAPSASV